jgi:polysaccharide biosynthesis/export protein
MICKTMFSKSFASTFVCTLLASVLGLSAQHSAAQTGFGGFTATSESNELRMFNGNQAPGMSLRNGGAGQGGQNPLASGTNTSTGQGVTNYVAPLEQAPRRAPPAVVETEFQRFVKRTTGQPLQHFGTQLFADTDAGYGLPVDVTPVTQDYILGVGDEVVIRAWGSIDVDFKATIDRNGQINLPKVGTFMLAGTSAADFERTVQQRFARLYTKFTLTANLGKLRPLRVYVVGQAAQPRLYTMPAMSTLLSAIFTSGGPNSSGSMRSITLQRGGRAQLSFDIYDFLLKGDRSKDASLMDGDTVVFNPAGPRIALLGAVDKAGIYEFKAGESSVYDLLGYAGGLSATTSTLSATLERLSPTQSVARSLAQVSLDVASQRSTALMDGDVLTLMPVRDEFQNAVTLRGNVAMPLRYPFRANMRVRDLIPDRAALITADYYQRKNILVQNINTKPAVAASEAKAEGSFTTSNANANKGIAGAGEGSTAKAASVLTDSLNLADNINWDYAVIERLRPDLTVALIPFNLGKAVLEGDPAHNVTLEQGDVISVFSNRDLRTAQSKLNRTVRLEGEFTTAGVYQVQPGETLRQLIARVGGMTNSAYLYGASLTRNSVRVSQQKSMDDAVERLERDINLQNVSRASNALDAQSAAQPAQAAAMFVAKLKSIKATGRLVMPTSAESGLADLPNIEIEDGDVLYVPPKLSTVSVLGAVHNENTAIYTPGKTLKQYLESAGGATPSADTNNIYILRANGSLSRKTNGWLGWLGSDAQLRPGDSVVVPEDIRRFETVSNYRNWAQVFSQFALGVASLKVLGIY